MKATLALDLDAPEVAQAALAPDDDGFVTSEVRDGQLHITAESESIMGLLRSLDDVLGCLRATGLE